jgi:ADP-ribose pyrophosphatase YjhB (NUDIX family)
MKEYKYCPMCASSLERNDIEGRSRLNCPKCGWINFLNPLPVVACLVSNKAGDILLIKRNVEPCKGHWALPGGFIEVDETLEEAGLRELLEETDLKGKPGRLVGVHVQESKMYGAVIMTGLEFIVESENVAPGDDAADAKFFPRGELPELPFAANRKLIAEYHA